MRHPFASLGLAALAATVAFPAFASTLTTILGKDPGHGDGYSCFSRTYDDAHLAKHPRQNVTRMTLFMSSTYDKDDGRVNDVEVGVGFRTLKQWYQMSGGCDTSVDGRKTMSCGGDCGGGSFSVASTGRDGVLVSIPGYVDIWDASASDDNEGADLPRAAAFGRDDKSFQLQRVDVKECKALMPDDARTAIFGLARRDE